MAQVQQHYDLHLGPIYSWMLGDAAMASARAELQQPVFQSLQKGLAVDLGAGPGTHAVALAEMGFSVLAIDACEELLKELRWNARSLPVRAVNADLLGFRIHCDAPVRVVVCMNDTLTHLPSRSAVGYLLQDVRAALAPGGVFVATFRDYVTAPLSGGGRFIPVRSDNDKILTCFLEYLDDIVMVHDVLHSRSDAGWSMKVSAYPKLRLDPNWVQMKLRELGFDARLEPGARGMVRLVAVAP